MAKDTLSNVLKKVSKEWSDCLKRNLEEYYQRQNAKVFNDGWKHDAKYEGKPLFTLNK